jgi:cysteine desulfurase
MRVNGDPAVSVPGILNVSFPDIEGEFLVTQLDAQGVAVSAKSACLSRGGEGSYVVAAIDPERSNGAIRFSFGRATTEEDVDYTISVLGEILKPRM